MIMLAEDSMGGGGVRRGGHVACGRAKEPKPYRRDLLVSWSSDQ
jgi:hypothetical protein